MAQAAAAEETATESVRESKEAAEVAVERAAEAVIAAEEVQSSRRTGRAAVNVEETELLILKLNIPSCLN